MTITPRVKITPQELATWARIYGNIQVQARLDTEQSRPLQFDSPAESLEMSLALLEESDLKEQLSLLLSKMRQGTGLMSLMLEKMHVFGWPIISVVSYGTLYFELDKTLLRFANKPEELAFDYFGPSQGRCDGSIPD